MASKSPDAFRTISEVADWLGVQPHVLRFWESKFSQVKPVKRAGGRRYYRPNDMLLLGGIRQLLHEDGLTIKGAQKVLREQGMAHVAAMSKPLDEESAALAEEAGANETIEPATTEDATPVPEAGFVEAPVEETPVATFAPKEDTDAPVAEPPLQESETAQEDVDQGHLPAFLTDNAAAEPAQTEQASETDEPELPMMDEAPVLDSEPELAQAPESLSGPEDFDAGAPEAVPAPEDVQVDAEPEPEAAESPVEDAPDDTLKPLIVDAPDPDENLISAHPGTLSAAFRVSGMTDADRAALTPLVAQLAALRDRMAAERGR